MYATSNLYVYVTDFFLMIIDDMMSCLNTQTHHTQSKSKV